MAAAGSEDRGGRRREAQKNFVPKPRTLCLTGGFRTRAVWPRHAIPAETCPIARFARFFNVFVSSKQVVKNQNSSKTFAPIIESRAGR
eukprot:COSAG04_NODE_6367_length_1345_cov_10.079454_1_plen_87_part_10